MGNCKPCSCDNETEFHYEVAIKHDPETQDIEEVPRSYPVSHKKQVSKLEALWIGYSVRKQISHYRSQMSPEHPYFSWSEIKETLNTRPGEQYHGSHNYLSRSIYTGEWLGGFRQGSGSMKYPDGEYFEGEWSYGRPFGMGKFVHIDGDSYEGPFKQYFVPKTKLSGDLLHIKNTAKDGYGNFYLVWLSAKQELLNTKRPVSFKSYFKHRSSTEASSLPKQPMKNKNSLSLLKNEFSSVVENLKQIKKAVLGQEAPRDAVLYEYSNGNRYDGQWKHLKRHGWGRLQWANGDVYEGEWKADTQAGIGTMNWVNGNNFVGEFTQNYKEGVGEYIWADGSKFCGRWAADKMNGIGKYTWANGQEYLGHWENGYRSGFGSMKYTGSRRYEGEFFRDKPNGYGVLFEGIKRKKQGNWEDGKFIE